MLSTALHSHQSKGSTETESIIQTDISKAAPALTMGADDVLIKLQVLFLPLLGDGFIWKARRGCHRVRTGEKTGLFCNDSV